MGLPVVISSASICVLVPTFIKLGENDIKLAPVELATFDNTNVVALVTEDTVVPDEMPIPVTAHPTDTALKLPVVVSVLLPDVLVQGICTGGA